MADAAAREETQAELGTLAVPLQLNPHSSSAPSDRTQLLCERRASEASLRHPSGGGTRIGARCVLIEVALGRSLSAWPNSDECVLPAI